MRRMSCISCCEACKFSRARQEKPDLFRVEIVRTWGVAVLRPYAELPYAQWAVLLTPGGVNPAPTKTEGTADLCETRTVATFLLQVEFVVERQDYRRAADHDFVGAVDELPFVAARVPDGEVFGFDRDADLFCFAGFEPDFVPTDEALGWFAGGGGERGIDLGDFCAVAAACVFHGEADVCDFFAGGDFQS
jgi:hypothetical protein